MRVLPLTAGFQVQRRSYGFLRIERRGRFGLQALRRDLTGPAELCDNRLGARVTQPHQRAVIDRFMLSASDTLSGHFCWKAPRGSEYGLPFEAVIRLEGASAAGPRHDSWYGKQYRRIVERRRGVFYRATWTERLASGGAAPDLWRAGKPLRQDFALAIPGDLAPGTYELRVKVRRVPLLPVRTVADYLSNEDSQHGTAIALIYLE